MKGNGLMPLFSHGVGSSGMAIATISWCVVRIIPVYAYDAHGVLFADTRIGDQGWLYEPYQDKGFLTSRSIVVFCVGVVTTTIV